jgi:hypothetical protein
LPVVSGVASLAAQTVFPGNQIFAPPANHLVEVTFVVPGTASLAATVTAFGAVLLDVDRVGLSSLTLYGVGA